METALVEAAAALAAPLAAGALVGALMGALRMGGAATLAPLLLYAYESVGFEGLPLAPVALGTAAAAVAAMAGRAAWIARRRDALDVAASRRLAPWAASSGLAAAALLSAAGPEASAGALGAAALVTALILVFVEPQGSRLVLGGWRGGALAAAIGALAGGAAQGAGAAGAPLLRRAGLQDARAGGLLAALGAAAAAPAALVFLSAPSAAAPPFALGSVDLTAVVVVPVAAALTAPHGARVARGAPHRALALGHALLLAILGLGLLRAALLG